MKRRPRGFSLVESSIALTILGLALVGIAQLQILAARSNQFARRIAVASTLATDFADQMSLWAYDDPRLAPLATVASAEDPQVVARTSFGRLPEVPSDRRPQFGEPNDGVASTSNALALGGRRWLGQSPDLDGDGTPDANRYWSVFAVDADADGAVEGKLVVTVVRWSEPGLGMREVGVTTFRANPAVLAP